MKKLLIIAAIFTVVSLSADAQQLNKRGQDNVSPEKRAQMRAERMADQLELTEEQKAQIYEIHLNRALSQQKMREAQKEKMRARRSTMQEVRKEQITDVEEVLTPDQRQKWKELRNQDQERMDRYRDARGNKDGERIRKERKQAQSKTKIRGNRPNNL